MIYLKQKFLQNYMSFLSLLTNLMHPYSIHFFKKKNLTDPKHLNGSTASKHVAIIH